MKDKRLAPPAGMSAEAFGKQVTNRLPMSTMTKRESWCLLQYIKQLERILQ